MNKKGLLAGPMDWIIGALLVGLALVVTLAVTEIIQISGNNYLEKNLFAEKANRALTSFVELDTEQGAIHEMFWEPQNVLQRNHLKELVSNHFGQILGINNWKFKASYPQSEYDFFVTRDANRHTTASELAGEIYIPYEEGTIRLAILIE